MSGHLRLRAVPLFFVVAVLGVGLFSPAALAGKKKTTAVVVDSSTVSTGKDKQLSVSGHLTSARGCLQQRSMELFQTDQNGVITGTLSTTTTSADGTWKMQVKRPQPSTGNDFFKVKAKKLVTEKFVCRAGFSPAMPVPHPSK